MTDGDCKQNLQIESVVVCRIRLIRGAQAQHQGAIKSRANANLKLHPARRHYRIASPRITVVFLSYLSYPRQECNTGNRTPGHEGVARGHGGTPRLRTRVPSSLTTNASTHNVRTIMFEKTIAFDSSPSI